MPNWLRTLLLVAIVLVVSTPGWADDDDDGGGRPRADLSVLVIVGDSLSAGFQNGSLLDAQQANSFPALVAGQADVDLIQPLIAPPGIPNVLTLLDPGPPPVIVPEPGVSTGRVDPAVQVTNLAVPGATAEDALSTRPDGDFLDLTDFVLGLPGLLVPPAAGGPIIRSQVEWAEALLPTTIFLWLGNNDVLGPVIGATDPSLITPADQFEATYSEIIGRLAATGATIVVANIPDVTILPFLTTAEDVASGAGAPLSVIGPILGIGAGSFVTPDGLALVPGILANPASGPLPANTVLTPAEVAEAQDKTAELNRIIRRLARRAGAGFVNVARVLDRIDRRGLRIGRRRITTDFLGGSFSLDGVHPTRTGYAIVANEFIRVLNRRFRARIRPANLRRIAAEDPLVPAPESRPPRGRPKAEDTREMLRILGDDD